MIVSNFCRLSAHWIRMHLQLSASKNGQNEKKIRQTEWEEIKLKFKMTICRKNVSCVRYVWWYAAGLRLRRSERTGERFQRRGRFHENRGIAATWRDAFCRRETPRQQTTAAVLLRCIWWSEITQTGLRWRVATPPGSADDEAARSEVRRQRVLEETEHEQAVGFGRRLKNMPNISALCSCALWTSFFCPVELKPVLQYRDSVKVKCDHLLDFLWHEYVFGAEPMRWHWRHSVYTIVTSIMLEVYSSTLQRFIALNLLMIEHCRVWNCTCQYASSANNLGVKIFRFPQFISLIAHIKSKLHHSLQWIIRV